MQGEGISEAEYFHKKDRVMYGIMPADAEGREI